MTGFLNDFMKEALRLAKVAFDKGEVPVGAVIVENGKIIASSYNQNRLMNDSTAHAEILALKRASNFKKNHRLDGCDLYVTLEPCTMCAAAISLSRIKRVYYSLPDEKFGAVENGVRFFSSKTCQHKPEFYSGFLEESSKKLMVDFFVSKR